ncbi:MAG TPA: DUF721 domain-containing protein [Candidatus Coprenecus stercorigallinarum]|nr:DUF721 domain-containing protein [Candidatus Coprenecus stercorigallinarum]
MQRTGEKLLAEILKDYIKDAGIADRLRAVDVCAVWREVVGPRVAAASDNVYFSGGVLYCRMTSSIVRNNVYYSLDGIRAEMNRRLGGEEVRKIVLR